MPTSNVPASPASAPHAPLAQREVAFHTDRVVAVLVPSEGPDNPDIFVPIRPLCEQLGISWPGQFERIKRDQVLSEVTRGVRVTRTPEEGGEQEMLCLPIEFLNGWLFGIAVARVKPELREKILRYQRDCYRVLWEAFRPELLAGLGQAIDADTIPSDLYNLRVGMNGVLDYLWRRQQHDDVVRRLLEMVRLDVHEVGGLIESGGVLTERQRQTIYQLGLEVAALMGQLDPQHNPFAIVFGAVKKTYGVSTYREIPRRKYRQVHEYLSNWKEDLKRQIKETGQEPCIL